jgi:threonine dehydratase
MTTPSLFDRILLAHAAIRPQVAVTPLERSNALSAAIGCDVMLKAEHLQPTGSFKIRGATNKIRVLGEAARDTGVITASTGNHGQAVARAGAIAGVPVTVYVAASTAASKMEAIRRWGAELVVLDGNPLHAELEARRRAAQDNKPYISPYNDLDVVAGQGTLGVELAEQAAQLDAVFISVGCGGLIGGTGSALKRLRPETRVVGVWPENSPCLLRALEAGSIIDVPESATLSDGTAGAVEPGSITFPICQSVIDQTVTVTESQIAAAMRHIAATERWIVEGAAGVALAGLVKLAHEYQGRKVAVVLCGRNIALETFLNAVG